MMYEDGYRFFIGADQTAKWEYKLCEQAGKQQNYKNII